MNPFHFGSSRQPLYGVYHPPRGQGAREHGVLLCAPMGQEYMRAHRAFRQLAMLLARAGIPVLRFDYFGTGDSAGDSDEGTVAQWLDDVGTAADELKDTASVRRVSLVGLRLGALLAARAAKGRDDVDRLVMWDPVASGRAYADELVAMAEPAGAAAVMARGETVGVLGFPLTRALHAGLAELDAPEAVPARGILTVVSADDFESRQLHERVAAGNASAAFDCIPSDGRWGEVDNFGSALIPQQIIQRIVAFLA